MKKSSFSFFLDLQHTEGLDNLCSYFPWTSFLKEVKVKVKHIREVKGTFLCFSLGNETLWLWAPEIKVILLEDFYYSTKVNTVKCYLRNFSFSAKKARLKSNIPYLTFVFVERNSFLWSGLQKQGSSNRNFKWKNQKNWVQWIFILLFLLLHHFTYITVNNTLFRKNSTTRKKYIHKSFSLGHRNIEESLQLDLE